MRAGFRPLTGIMIFNKSLDMVEPVKAIVKFPSPYGDYDF